MWGCLHSNFAEVELHLLDAKPDFLFLSETGTATFIQVQELEIRATRPY